MTFREYRNSLPPDAHCEPDCPFMYGLESKGKSMINCSFHGGAGCTYCWNREMPDAESKAPDKAGKEKAKTTREACLDAAKKCICGDRDEQYGTPENSFWKIAKLWRVYLEGNCHGDVAALCLDATDVANMMILFKIARASYIGGSKDTYIDIAGYAACGYECQFGGDYDR